MFRGTVVNTDITAVNHYHMMLGCYVQIGAPILGAGSARASFVGFLCFQTVYELVQARQRLLEHRESKFTHI